MFERHTHFTIRVRVTIDHVRRRQSINVCKCEVVRRCQLRHPDVIIAMKGEIDSASYSGVNGK